MIAYELFIIMMVIATDSLQNVSTGKLVSSHGNNIGVWVEVVKVHDQLTNGFFKCFSCFLVIHVSFETELSNLVQPSSRFTKSLVLDTLTLGQSGLGLFERD